MQWLVMSVMVKVIVESVGRVRVPKRMNGGHFPFKNVCCRFWTFIGFFLDMIPKKLQYNFPKMREWVGGGRSKAVWNFSENSSVLVAWPVPIVKYCLLTGQEQACTRITWLFVCLFLRSAPCQKWLNTQENGCWLPPRANVITSKVKPFSRPDNARKEEWLVQPAFCLLPICLFCLGVIYLIGLIYGYKEYIFQTLSDFRYIKVC